MKTKVFKIVAIGFLIYAAAALAILSLYQADPNSMNWQERETFNLKNIGLLDIGTPKDDVIRKLGSPDISEGKETEKGPVLVLFYRTHHVKSDGITTRDECTPLLFRDNLLIGWGEDAYSEYLKF
ncbi:DUF3192 domain-containing protein [Idiomarina xiamenensis]|uniref:SmpA /OmlA family lipoprotein n=1 Tax=Idiomarina xiamenensis 10-D-4 TaxID=740709 RepID=K2KDQ8_9GAMM|nr:DUF3192 domain-containing protein [Idiomarina xiamenensis]EKE84867.1 SmpA /OmlA family lipoprotein [Idiomarina xiamenensis 10-D-4]